jgi:4-hydroxythreonine-4-phosphate dehydrogenase
MATGPAPQPFNPLAPLALTQGDPSGIGPEIALKAWLGRKPGQHPFFLLADPAHIAATARALSLDIAIEETSPPLASRIFERALPVVPTGHRTIGTPGVCAAKDAAGTIAAIEIAARLVAEGEASAMVTNPITKDSLYRAGFKHPGHTEFLGELAQQHYG